KQLANVPVPLDHFLVNTLTSKVFSFMDKKGKHFSGNVIPLFASMLVQPTEDEGAHSERPSEAQPTPSPAHTSEVPFKPHTDSSPAHTTTASSTNLVNTVSIPVSTASPHEGLSLSNPTNPEEDDLEIPPLEDIY
ncbi:hypothetical protein Tco_0120218, partial [Tanacetum coccineum]